MTLPSVTSKTFCKIIKIRIKDVVDDVMREEKTGFKKGRMPSKLVEFVQAWLRNELINMEQG